jgi:hypothetical protein
MFYHALFMQYTNGFLSSTFFHTLCIKVMYLAHCFQKQVFEHRVYRVPGFLSSRPKWVPHPFIRKGLLLLPTLRPRGEGVHSLAGEGVGGPNSDEWTDTLVLYLYYSTSKALNHDLNYWTYPGVNNTESLNTCWKYLPESNTWEVTKPLTR